MIVYKLTCSSGRVYYGSSSFTLKERKRKGWKTCSCKDFDIIKMEVIEEVEDKEKALERESYYIENFPCVNKKTAKPSKKWKNKCERERKNKYEREWSEKIKKEKKYYCDICKLALTGKSKLTLHRESKNHKFLERYERCKAEEEKNVK